jgi:monoamine oxidase
MSSRRGFIKEAALITGATFLDSSPISAFFIPKKKKVIIIGAGFAGLSAAYSLYQRHIDFELIESRNEVGGRVFSHLIDKKEKLTVELGAEWVGEDHAFIMDLCDRFHLPLDNNQFDTQVVYKGRYYKDLNKVGSPGWNAKYEQIIKDYQNLTEAQKEAKGRVLDKMDWWRYLVNNGCSGTDLDLRELTDSTDFGESIRHVSAYAALDEYARSSECSRNEMDYKIRGGNQQLAFKLKALFANKIRFAHRVQKVVQGDKVKVYCENGYVATGDQLICTAPTFAVKKIDWQPALPPSMGAAMDALQYARINKNALLFNNRFWKDERFDMITDMPGHYFYHATKHQQSVKGALISYTIGDKAAVVANQSDAWRTNTIQESLYPAFPNIRHLLEKQTNYYWGNNDYSMGAYAMYGKGEWFDLFPKLNKSHIHTHFAGEHLSEIWQGFMEGALETGKAAADRI